MKGMIWRALCYASPLYIITICCFLGLTLCAWIDTDAEMSIYEAIIIPLMLTLFFSFVPLSAIHSDISSGMLKWLMTSPMKTSDYVREKYVTVYFFIVIFLLLSSGELIIYMCKTTGFDLKQYVFLISLIFALVNLALCITLPIMLRASSVAGLSAYTFSMIAIMFALIIASIVLKGSQTGIAFISELMKIDISIIALIVFAISAAILAASYIISSRLLKNKQF